MLPDLLTSEGGLIISATKVIALLSISIVNTFLTNQHGQNYEIFYMVCMKQRDMWSHKLSNIFVEQMQALSDQGGHKESRHEFYASEFATYYCVFNDISIITTVLETLLLLYLLSSGICI